MTDKPTGVWLRDADLVYRLADTPHGISNCDEIKVSQVDGRRLSAACQERAEELLVALQAVERAKMRQPPHDGIRKALATVPSDGEWRGFAAECAQQYGAEYLDDDARLVVMTEENLINMMAVLGYPTANSSPRPAPIRRECNNDECGWVGPESETVHPKHDSSTLLCPKCHETTELVSTALVNPPKPEHN